MYLFLTLINTSQGVSERRAGRGVWVAVGAGRVESPDWAAATTTTTTSSDAMGPAGDSLESKPPAALELVSSLSLETDYRR